MIYFVQGERLVKIGFSRQPYLRFLKMKTDSATVLELRLVIEGELADEKALHRQFSELRVHGEWFSDDGRIARLIKHHLKQGAHVPRATKLSALSVGGRPSTAELRSLGISQPHAWKLAHGQQLPSLELAQRIEREIGYPAGAWRLEEAA